MFPPNINAIDPAIFEFESSKQAVNHISTNNSNCSLVIIIPTRLHVYGLIKMVHILHLEIAADPILRMHRPHTRRFRQ